ncbi:MAG: M36 family metallopeptidase [Verrucomicrobiia bacterium]
MDAVSQVQQKVPGARVDFDPILASPSFVASPHGFLTGSNGLGLAVTSQFIGAIPADDPDRVTKAFLNEHVALFGHGAEVLANARRKREFVTPHNGLHTVVWEQQLDGIPVFEGLLIAHTTIRGELVSISSRFIPDVQKAADAGMSQRATIQAPPPIRAEEAIARAAANVEETVDAADIRASGTGAEQRLRYKAAALPGETEVRQVWLPVNRNSMRLCWEVQLTSRKRGEMFLLVVDAETGEILVRHGLTEYYSDATYRVYTSDSPSPYSPGCAAPCTTQPPLVARDLVTLSALSANDSPAGWISDGQNTTAGNNVDAHLDKDGDNVPDPGSRPTGNPFRVFDCSMDLAQQPVTYTNAAVVQLFYWCNWMHDKLYELGFTEAAGNFQNDNFGRGGLGNDAVQADAQDGSGSNNANFSTPPDGSPGRMQMYIFNYPTPNRDGDFDAEVILHEYTHGLSNRRVGGGVGISALQSAGMGEGWSDFYAESLLSQISDDPNAAYANGGYVTYQLSGLTQNYYFGIRRYPYSTDMTKNPLTFKDIDPSQASAHTGVPRSPIIGTAANEVHNMGEVWCVTLWGARANLIAKYGSAAGNQLMLQLVTDGMNLSPANPTFLQARDAILQADQVDTGGANKSELWAAFAKRGMGASATSPASSTTTGLVEAYDVPDSMKVTPGTGFNSSGGIGGPFSPASQMYAISNSGTSTLNWTAGKTAAWLNISSTSGSLNPGPGSNTVVLTINATANNLSAGAYSDTVTFSNRTSGMTQTRAVTLTVHGPVIFLADFEDGNGGYSADGFTYTADPDATSNLWHGTARRSVSPSHSQYYGLESTGNYNTGARNAGNLLSPSISLTGVTGPIVLSYQYFLQTENVLSYDIATAQISSNAGNTWITLATLANSASFATVTNDISAYAGRNILIRFNFDTIDGIANTFEGWYIDDVMITGAPLMPRITVTVPTTATEGDGVLAGQGAVYLSSVPTNNVIVMLASSDTSEATVPVSLTIPPGATNAIFDITIIDDTELDGPQSATITASAAGCFSGNASITVNDNETATLSIALPTAATEGDGVLANAGTVYVSAPVSTNVVVSLGSSDTTEIVVPSSVTVSTGQTNATFDITVVDDNQIDGPQPATVTAHVAGWIDGNATITVLDNENTNLTVTLPSFFREGQGQVSNGCTVRISGTLPSALTVNLLSSDTTELTVPASVTISAGQTSAVFTATVVDDSETDGAQPVTVTASAAGFVDGSADSTVLDNDVHHFAWSTISSPQTSGVPFTVSVTALDINGLTISNYAGSATLSAAGDAGPATITPATTGAFTNGVWTGSATVNNLDTNVRMTADDGAGHTGQSSQFDVAQAVGVLGIVSGSNVCNAVLGTASNGQSFGTVTAGLTYNYQASGCISFASGQYSDPDGKHSWDDCTTFDGPGQVGGYPNFLCPGLTNWSLVGKIGGTCIQLGKSGSMVAPASGTLTLYCNDQIGLMGDNSGLWNVCLLGFGTDLVSTGSMGGPFAPPNQTYTLTNSGNGMLTWFVTNMQNWVSLSATSGTLAPQATTNIMVLINSDANSLAVGDYSDTVTFTNLSNGNGTTTRGVALTITPPANLAVTPTNELSATGIQGGPFAPSSQTYTLTNSGGNALNWSASKIASWLTLSTTNGSLAVGNGATVTVSINANANSLAAGSYADSVTFTNTTNGAGGGTRGVTLTINVPGVLSVSPASYAFGTLLTGATAQASFTITNSGAGLLTGTASGASGPFTIVSGSAYSISPNSSTNVVVQFSPTSLATFSNSLIFASDGGNSTNLVTGTGGAVPVADFSATPTNGLAPLTVTFTDSSTGTISNRSWLFGDGASASTLATIVSHTYTTGGINTVTLTVDGPLGSSFLTRTNAIVVTGVPALGVTPASYAFGTLLTGATAQASFTVTNSGTGPLTGTASGASGAFTIVSGSAYSISPRSSANVVVQFAPTSLATFSNSLIFASDGGNSTNLVTGTGGAVPVADFSATPTNGLAPLTVTFTDFSTGTITNRSWLFGDGASTNALATIVSHTYTSGGTNSVTLTVDGPLGSSCLTQTNAVVVMPLPPNSWINAGSDKWEGAGNWSDGVPNITQPGLYITNANSKTVTIDAVTTNTPGCLTISNLTVLGSAGATNTLSLNNIGSAIPLRTFSYDRGLTLDTNASVVVNNSALVVANNGSLTVGDSGAACSLLITNKGNVSANWCCLGNNAGSGNNMALVGGPGSIWNSYSNLIVGASGSGNALVITNHGSVLDNTCIVGQDLSSSGNLAVVNGPGSMWTNTYLYVGYHGSGNQLTIANGGHVASLYSYLGYQYSAGYYGNNLVVVSDTGSVWSASHLYIGYGENSFYGGNTLVITNGGAVISGTGYLSYQNVGSNNMNVAVVTGPGSLWNSATLYVGWNGCGDQLVISGGGAVVSSVGYVGYSDTLVCSNNIATVCDPGSVWSNSSLYVGYSNIRCPGNQLVVTNGGTVFASNLVVGVGQAANSLVRIESGTLRVAGANGTGGLILGQTGPGRLLLDAGTVTVNQLVLTNGVNSMFTFNGGRLTSGGTFVTNNQLFVVGDATNAATFQLNGGVHSFAGNLEIRNNAALTGCGTVTGNVAVDPGGNVAVDCGGTLTFTGIVTNNGAMHPINGSVLEFYGTMVNNGTIDITAGTTNFHGIFVNNGTIVTPPAPVASFTASPTNGVAVSLNVNFTDSSTGSIWGWHWDFGDGNTSTAQNPAHSYAAGTRHPRPSSLTPAIFTTDSARWRPATAWRCWWPIPGTMALWIPSRIFR